MTKNKINPNKKGSTKSKNRANMNSPKATIHTVLSTKFKKKNA
jgi:hypothetical protein